MRGTPSTFRPPRSGRPAGSGRSGGCQRACASRGLYFAPVSAVHARYYTDPASPWCWAIEPHVRRLTLELEGQLELTYVMAGIREIAPAALEAFGADLDRARAVPEEHQSPERGRVKIPSIEFRGEDGEVHGVYGPAPYEAYRDAAVAAGAELQDRPAPGVEEALQRFGTMATVEVAAICDLPGPRAAAELWRLASAWRVR